MNILRCSAVLVVIGLLPLAVPPPLRAVDAPPSLRIAVCQLALEATLAQNRDKIAGFIRQAKDRGCRVAVFPETALYWPPKTPRAEIDAAVEELQKTANEHDIYVLLGGPYQRHEKEKPFERLLVIDPRGQIIQTYHKMWSDARFNDVPGLFEIDGVPCAAAICADRWIRSVEELPAMSGAKILFEVSNNYADEWLPDLGWFWYVPRALRNEVFVVFANTAREDRAEETPGHGHSAVIAPSGAVLTAAGEESDQLLVQELDLAQAAGNQALARRSHPAFEQFWKTGTALLNGNRVAASPPQPPPQRLASPQVEIKIAAAQLACSRSIDDNLANIERLVREAEAQHADVVVFPELAVTGARAADIAAATADQLAAALARLQQTARQSQIHVVCGLPWLSGDQRQNCAVAIDPDGRLLTRYAQLVVDRPELFTAGTAARPMWFELQGVPCVLTIGRDALWSEIAELAALRGAQVHLHLAYGREVSPAADLRRQQLWVNLASFRTFTATVNAASPAKLASPSEPASGGSTLWDDYHRGSRRQFGGYGPYSAVRLASAGQDQTILYATQTTPKTNPQFRLLTEKTDPHMTPWYAAGANAIFAAPLQSTRHSEN